MTVVSSDALAIATLIDWLKNFAPVFRLMRSKLEANRSL